MIVVPMVIAKIWALCWQREHNQKMAQARNNFDESGLGKLSNYGFKVLIAGLVLYILYRSIVN
jgi:hypothetical protein